MNAMPLGLLPTPSCRGDLPGHPRGPFSSHLPQVYPHAPRHAELCFLSWFQDEMLSPHEQQRVTWFVSWSPCSSCAKRVAQFLQQHRNVTLSIFAARLSYFWDPATRQGLRRLCGEGAPVDIMSLQSESRGGGAGLWGRRGEGPHVPPRE